MRNENSPERIVECWNENCKVGQTVIVKKDFEFFGTLTTTITPAQVMCNEAVVWLEGISGAYSLSCIIPLRAEEE